VNTYYEVDSVFSTYLTVAPAENLSSLKPGDKILLVQMSGVLVNSTGDFYKYPQGYNLFEDAGKYYLLCIKSVDNLTHHVYFTVSINAGDFTNGEKIQMVKIYEGNYITVDSTLTAGSWDGEKGKGGIVALVVFKKLTLNADIDVSAKGFRGGNPDIGLTWNCNPDTIYYYDSDSMGVAAKKGEGNVRASWQYTRGPGAMATGGGGGIGKFAGGAGGGNFGSGGFGGAQKLGCTSVAPAYGGIALNAGTPFYDIERITMGGGGGSSTQDITYQNTRGGNGGGIVIIIADTIEPKNNYKIISNGESLSGALPDAGGGGGGGAGGSIFLDVNVYKIQLEVSLNGGKGSNTANESGAGGGGGGGILRFQGLSLPNISPTFAGGAISTAGSGDNSLRGTVGSPGNFINNLQLPIKGFLFNAINGVDTICKGQPPKTITGSTPKVGPIDSLQWLKSIDSVNWILANGTSALTYLNSVSLDTTTWFRRIVFSGVVYDTSLPEKVYVYQPISNNILSIRDTLCSGSNAGLLVGSSITGGSHNYEYQWQSSIDHSTWSDRDITSYMIEGNLDTTTYYRRIVTSAKVCTNTSNIDTLTVLEAIRGNTFSPDTAICQNLDAGVIKPHHPSGGDGNYRYSWLNSGNGSSYSLISGLTSETYAPGTLSADQYYRRIVYSGEGNACQSISPAYYIQVYDLLSDNNISSDSTRYCSGTIPLQINGLRPTGGDGSSYQYKWRSSLPGGIWTELSGAASQTYSNTASYTDTFRIERIVISGDHNACKDTSNYVQIDIIPAILNTLLSHDSAICKGAKPLPFSEFVASGGAGSGTYQYLWQDSILPSSWQAASQELSANNLPAYSSGSLDTTTWFRRKVLSQICSSFSNLIKIEVYPSIKNNIIQGGEDQYICNHTSKELNGTIPNGGNYTFHYNWQQSGDNLMWSNVGEDYQSYTTPELSNLSYYQRIVRSGVYDQCIDTSSVILVHINSLPTGEITNAIDTVCEGDSIEIYYVMTGNSPWTLKLGEPGDTLYSQDNITVPGGTISFPINNTVDIAILDISDDSTCHAEQKTGVYKVVAYPIPIPVAGVNGDTCGLDYKLHAITSLAENTYWTWRGISTAFESPQSPNSLVTVDGYGEQIFTWNESNWNCLATDDVTVIFYEQPESIDAGDDQPLDYKFETNLNAVVPSVGIGYWSWNDSNTTIDDTTLYNAHITLQNVGIYKFIWTVKNGSCIALNDSVFVTVGDLQIFSGFSPNGDDYNPEFILELSGREVSELIILNINGGLVFSTTGTDQIKWDGRNSNGKEVPEGTYFYIVKEPGVSDRKGFIELRR